MASVKYRQYIMTINVASMKRNINNFIISLEEENEAWRKRMKEKRNPIKQ